MAKELHLLPNISEGGGLAGQDLLLVKKYVAGTPLDFKADVNTLFVGYLNDSDVGQSIGQLFRLVDDGLGNAGLPAISGNLLTNLNIPTATASVSGATLLSDAINGSQGVTNGTAATPKAVADLNNIAFKKTGGEVTGSITLSNNVPFRLKYNSGASMDVLTLDTSNDLLIGVANGAPDQIKAYVDTSFSVHNTAGQIVYYFGTDGTSTGIKALDVTAAAKTGLLLGTVDSQLGTLATTKLSTTGGTLTGNLILGATASINGLTDAGSTLELVTVDGQDFVIMGTTSTSSAGTIIRGPSDGDIFFEAGGQNRMTIRASGAIQGIDSTDVAFPTGTGGITATNVGAALSWLGSNTILSTGGSISGSLTLDNNLAYRIESLAGTPTNVIQLNTGNEIIVGNTANALSIMTNSFRLRNSSGSTRLSMTDTGYLSGVSLHSSTVNHNASGGVTEGFVGPAIQGLDTRKFEKSGGTLTGTISVNNNVAFSCKETGGAVRSGLWMDNSNRMRVGSGSTATRFQGGGMDWLNSSAVIHMSLSNAGVLSGSALQASTVNFSPAGGLLSTNVEDAINEVQANAISGEAAEFTGTINFANSIGITTRNAANNANLNTIRMVTGDILQVGGNSVNAIDLQAASAIRFNRADSTTIFQINPQAGTLSGFAANLITTTATGNIIAGNVQDAIAELDSEKLGRAGGTMTGNIIMNNSIAYRVKNNVGSDVDALYLSSANTMIIGNVLYQTHHRGNGQVWVNSAGTTHLTLSDAGILSGVALQASAMNTSVAGLAANSVQTALLELYNEKFEKSGGTISGSVTVTGGLTVTGNITGNSDIRKKTNIKSLRGALAKVRRIGGQTFDRTDIDAKQMGVIAQVVEAEFPEAVETDEYGMKSVAYGNLAAAGGFAAIDELATIVEERDEEISTLSIALDKQSDQISELREMVKSLLEK